jgi:formylglycine-generating enzyme required for sulfatase activity
MNPPAAHNPLESAAETLRHGRRDAVDGREPEARPVGHGEAHGCPSPTSSLAAASGTNVTTTSETTTAECERHRADDRRTAIVRGQPVRGPRKSSDVLTERLMQVRHRAEEAERQRDQTASQNRELREQVRILRESLDQRLDTLQEQVKGSEDSGLLAMRRELELVRSRASADLDALRHKLLETSQAQNATRNVELEAELQALRQESALLRSAINEKDKTLEELSAQCRGLEDILEDRDRELERLHRERERSRRQPADTEALPRSPPAPPVQDPVSEPRYQWQEKESKEVPDGSDLIFVPGPKRPWKPMTATALGGLILGVLVQQAILMLSDTDILAAGPFDVARESSASRTPGPARTASAPAAKPPVTAPTPTARRAPATTDTVAPTPTRAEAPPAATRTVRDRLRDGSLAPAMVAIPGGSFQMGNPRALAAREEQPPHHVRVDDFFIGKYEVTFAEYDRFAQATGRALPDDEGWGRDRRPVINVDWDDAQAYARWLSSQTGATYRLPSEAEWEYAAGGGSDNRYWWGFSLEPGKAVCFDCGSRWDNRSTAPVGALPANGYGLHEVAGNAMEWVADCYNRNYQGAPRDANPWLTGDCGQRMARGGSFNKPGSRLRGASRSQFPQGSRMSMLGFRLVRE